ncbi:MAG: heme d1 biosynthesis radical SAM protein NirJ [Rhodobacterales bacterium]|nr:heme d1 biosynthesis radical SAM protein NirJ [Rhodobacterales bacterium]
MFRVTNFLKELSAPTAVGPRRDPPGPVVIWNLIRRCNLTCKHCYAISADTDFPGELSTDQVFAVMDDLKAFRVPALILSGGEPLLRKDIFEISRRATDMGFYVGLSTNGTLIDAPLADRIADIGYGYVGISIDGIGATHDAFRRMDGGFDAAMAGLRLCRDRDLKVGLRFTMTKDNAHQLPQILDLLDAEDIDRFYFSHLNYAGRGNHNRKDDAWLAATRDAMDRLFDRCLAHINAGRPKEFVTGNNDADGVYLYHWMLKHHPDKAEHMRGKLVQWGGNASGVNVANIDNVGDVHPDTMWWHYTIGNVKDRPFGDIWMDTSDPLMAGLKRRPRAVTGRCGACAHLDICGGNTRVRAQQITGDPWAEDPACYLDDAEIGLAEPVGARVEVTPFSARRRAG